MTSALISTPGISVRPGGHGFGRHDLAVAGERVVVGDGKGRDARGSGGARRASAGLEHAVGAARVRVQVDRRWRRAARPGRGSARIVASSPRRGGRDGPSRQASMSRWIRSMRQRPSRGRVDVDLAAR